MLKRIYVGYPENLHAAEAQPITSILEKLERDGLVQSRTKARRFGARREVTNAARFAFDNRVEYSPTNSFALLLARTERRGRIPTGRDRRFCRVEHSNDHGRTAEGHLMKLFLTIVAALAVLSLVASIGWRWMTTMTLEQFDVDEKISDDLLIPVGLPEQRSFRMGFTYQPYDWSEEAFAQTLEYLKRHGDLITLFHDVGIPWEQALAQSPLPSALEQELRRQQAAAVDFQNVAVMLSILGPDRVSLCRTIDQTGSVERSGPWKDRSFDDERVITAYLNHARDLIERFDPTYFGYVAEVDSAFVDVEDERFQRLLGFSKIVYRTLKQEYPSLLVFAEFNLSDDAYMAARQDVIDAMLPWSDLYAVSTYADHADGVAGDATRLPEDWFSRSRKIAPSKPLAVMETGFIASPFMHPDLGIRIDGREDRLLIPGGPRSQALFMVKLLQGAHESNAEFVNLWAVRDLDRLFDRFAPESELSDPMLGTAQDRGLYDENGVARQSLEIWEAWRELPFEPRLGAGSATTRDSPARPSRVRRSRS